MEKKKLKLKELQIDSFITTIDNAEKNTIKGGTVIETILLSLETIHLIHETFKVKEGIKKIQETYALSLKLKTNCAGCTHTCPSTASQPSGDGCPV